MNTKPKTASSITSDLAVDRLWIVGSLIMSALTAVLLVYMTLNRGRVELVFLSEDKFDAPMMLDKISASSDTVRNDRYVKGMIRRFVSNFWITPDMTDQETLEALRWSIIHTSVKGQSRGRALIRSLEDFNGSRLTTWTSFKPLMDENSVTIQSSGMSSGRYLVSVPGTYVTSTQVGQHYATAVLRMIIVASGVSGLPDKDAGDMVNATGLTVDAAVLTLQNASDVPTIIELF